MLVLKYMPRRKESCVGCVGHLGTSTTELVVFFYLFIRFFFLIRLTKPEIVYVFFYILIEDVPTIFSAIVPKKNNPFINNNCNGVKN